jgi:hypothetical protein
MNENKEDRWKLRVPTVQYKAPVSNATHFLPFVSYTASFLA